MKRIVLPLLLLTLATPRLSAQQLHFTSMYLQHNSMYNPAAAGITGTATVGLSYRSMWSSFPGNPKTFILYGDANWDNKNAGFAGYIYRDITGPTSRTGLQLAYSYHITSRDQKGKLGLGLELRTLQYAIDKSKLTESLGSDPVLSGSSSKLKLDAGAGIYYTRGGLSAGLAVSQLIQSKLTFADVTGATTRAKLYRHYNFTANYLWQTGDNIVLIPNVMFRFIENSPSELDLGCKLDYRDKLWWALNWRRNQFWSLQAGFTLVNRLNVGYAYDYYETPISQFNTGSNGHEVSLRYNLRPTR
jgi:type IX secretion system PorP/SprF family membrane protein